MQRNVRIRGLVAAGLLLLASGCCSGFTRDFREAQRYCPPQQGLEGVWEGTWLSHSNGHNGQLQAIITRCDDHHYHARFRATFMKCIPYESEALLHVSQQGDTFYFSGEEDLGWLAGGVYRYDGYANACNFHSNYCADRDHGIFTMRRVSSCGGCGEFGCCE